MEHSSTLCFHPSVTSSDASIGREKGPVLVRFLSSLRPPLHHVDHVGYVLHSGSDPAWPVKYHFLHTPRRRGIYSFEGESAMDANPTDRSVEVGRTDSVSTLNYRPRVSCTGDTACQKGTRRESKQINRYI